jgi:hypothetical protein
MANLGQAPERSVTSATPGQITGTPSRVLRKLGIKVLRTRGVVGRRGRRR